MLLNTARIQILEEFLKDYEARITGSFIAEKKNLNQKSTANALKCFEEEGFLKSATQGKNRLYLINLGDAEMSGNFISAIEHLRAIEFYKKHVLIKEIAAKIVSHCDGIAAIFGSYAKGTAKKDSDLDIFVAGKCNEKEIEKVSDMYKIEINIKTYPLPIFEKALMTKDPLAEEVIKYHIIIKGIEQFAYYLRAFRYGYGEN